MTRKKTKYDDEPVEYCGRCLSLAIKEEDGIIYCSKCGCANDIRCASMEEWQQLDNDRKKREEEY